MITEPLPRSARLRAIYLKSEGLLKLPGPFPEQLQSTTDQFKVSLATGHAGEVQLASSELLRVLCEHFQVSVPPLKVLGVRPHRVEEGVCTYQLFGDYTPSTEQIRVWLRTAIRKQVSSPGALLATLLHELCHHLDNKLLSWPESPHTRGFYHRIDDLYHAALGTPPDQRRPLVWVKSGGVWRIDWTRLRGSKRAATR